MCEPTRAHTQNLKKGLWIWRKENGLVSALYHPPTIHSDTDLVCVAVKNRSHSHMHAQSVYVWERETEQNGWMSQRYSHFESIIIISLLNARTSLNDGDLIMPIYILTCAAYNKRLVIKMFRNERHIIMYLLKNIHSFIHLFYHSFRTIAKAQAHENSPISISLWTRIHVHSHNILK